MCVFSCACERKCGCFFIGGKGEGRGGEIGADIPVGGVFDPRCFKIGGRGCQKF